MTTWSTLGDPPPDTLAATRLQLHWAAQPLSSFGETYVAPRDDFRQRALLWSSPLHAMVTWGRTASGHRLCLDPLAFRLALLDASDVPAAALDLVGETLASSYEWLNALVGEVAGLRTPVTALPTDKLPDAPPREGVPFDGGEARARMELARWFANTDTVLADLRSTSESTTPVLVWPHHFDIATLITVRDHPDPEQARTIGVGMAPGDDAYPEPYVYVQPWPYPDPDDLGDLPAGGRWHADQWVGAVLTAEALVGGAQASEQERRIRAFVSGSVEGCRRLLA